MGTLFRNKELFAIFVRVAHEYDLPFLSDVPLTMFSGLDSGPFVDRIIMANGGLPARQWLAFYDYALKCVQPGITELVVHL